MIFVKKISIILYHLWFSTKFKTLKNFSVWVSHRIDMFMFCQQAKYIEIYHKPTEFGNKKLRKYYLTNFSPTLGINGVNFVEILLWNN